jgi:hypothetical protein
MATETHDFGILDDRGRKIGCWVRTYEEEHGTELVFLYRTGATRDGKGYGPIIYPNRFPTAAERDAGVAKYLKGALKRAVKKAGGNPT